MALCSFTTAHPSARVLPTSSTGSRQLSSSRGPPQFLFLCQSSRHVLESECCRYTGMLQVHWNVAGTPECCRYTGMLQVHWNVAGTLECCRYTGMFEEAEWTGGRLLQVESDAPLEKLGMYIEVDRKYILLQLSRVRDCKRVARRRLQVDDTGSLSNPLFIHVTAILCSCLFLQRWLVWPLTRQSQSSTPLSRVQGLSP